VNVFHGERNRGCSMELLWRCRWIGHASLQESMVNGWVNRIVPDKRS
jgi:hypothetical protein